MEIAGVTGYSGAGLAAVMPEPKNGLTFSKVLGAVKDFALDGAAEASGISDRYSPLLEKQLEMQEQMMLVSLVSNVEKTHHETRMAAVRNIRAA